MKTIIATERESRPRKPRYAKVATVKESRIVFFGSPTDPDVKESIRKAAIAGRKTETEPRPSFDTGFGPCGKHVCSCNGVCLEKYSDLEREFGL